MTPSGNKTATFRLVLKCLYQLSHPAPPSLNINISSLMFVLCIIRCSKKNQQYTLIFTTPLFYILAPTCFDSSLPSSGSFVDPSELLEIQIDLVV
jgi:hypothetical protein